MTGPPFRLQPLSDGHDRSRFDSGSEALDRYLRVQATQDIRRRVAACFVAVDAVQRIAGYYTLSAASVALDLLPAATAARLPRYPTVPAVRMGRLAIDRAFKGRGLGGALLADALLRSMRSEIAAYALIVDAKDESAAAFYRHHGFIALSSMPMCLFLPLAVGARLAGSGSAWTNDSESGGALAEPEPANLAP
jgi:ribosomal protein S18 acetylase RimI-like enzyme